ncbi:uncharacterized protein J3R85_007403 [Psidium guajava]|nr:uncharacterized protein J3R85_007403 [Psidium guajava]
MAMVVLTAILVVLLSLLVKGAYETISCYWWTPRRIKKIMERQGVRGPMPRLLVGNILDTASLVAKSTSDDMESIRHDVVPRLLPHYVLWSQQYGKRFVYWNGTEPRMCLTETELIKELLSKYSTLSGKSWLQQQGSKHFIGKGLLMANGDDWYHQRHIVAPAFMGDKLKSYAGYMVECSDQMLQSLRKAVDAGQTEFEISEYMARLTADIISRTEFDSSYEKGKQIFHLLTLLQHLCAQASRHLCLPGSRFPEIMKRENRIATIPNASERGNKVAEDGGGEAADGDHPEPEGLRRGGAELLLRERPARDAAQRDAEEEIGSGFSLNLQLIMDECKTFFFAGHDTTALLLTWTIMLLASNPSWQERVREEVAQVCNGANPSVEHLSKLTLLNMVINESLRLYPPASVLPRMAFEDIRLGDLHIPKGLSIWIPVLAIHHSEELWGEDANEFNPERFASKPFAPGRFMPFAMGPRNCIGQSFALMEAKIILAMLISRFSFTIAESYRHAPVIVLTIKPKYGVQICLKPLNP